MSNPEQSGFIDQRVTDLATAHGNECEAVSRRCSDDSEPIHLWFELSYSNYLVLPRSVLQSAPLEWQRRFVACLEELGEMAGELEGMPSAYTVTARDGGKFVRDPFSDYERGRRRVPLNIVQKAAA